MIEMPLVGQLTAGVAAGAAAGAEGLPGEAVDEELAPPQEAKSTDIKHRHNATATSFFNLIFIYDSSCYFSIQAA